MVPAPLQSRNDVSTAIHVNVACWWSGRTLAGQSGHRVSTEGVPLAIPMGGAESQTREVPRDIPCPTLLVPCRSSGLTSGTGCPSRGVVCTAVPEGGTRDEGSVCGVKEGSRVCRRLPCITSTVEPYGTRRPSPAHTWCSAPPLRRPQPQLLSALVYALYLRSPHPATPRIYTNAHSPRAHEPTTNCAKPLPKSHTGHCRTLATLLQASTWLTLSESPPGTP